MAEQSLPDELEAGIEALGFELVELERAGSKRRPILRVSIDRPDSVPGQGVTVDDCAAVSRALEARLDERADLPSTYVLEVGSPGVERPLVRPRDWRRFAGQRVALHGAAPLAGRQKRLEGELLGPIDGEADEPTAVRVKLSDEETVEVPLAEVERAHLVFDWGGKGKKPKK